MNDTSRMAKHGSLEDLVSVALRDKKERASHACTTVEQEKTHFKQFMI